MSDEEPQKLHAVAELVQVETDTTTGKPVITMGSALKAWGGEAVDNAVKAGRLRPIPGLKAYLILTI
jgi:hypothetical protein